MTQLHQRNLARHVLLARQGNGNGNGNGGIAGVGPIGPHSSSKTTDSSTSSTPASTPFDPLFPPSSSTQSTPSSTSDPVTSTTPPPPVVTSTTPTPSSSSSSSTPTSTSQTSSTITSSSTTSSSTTRSTSSVPAPTNTFTPIVNNDPLTLEFTSSSINAPSTTVSAAPTAVASSGLSAGSIVGAVAGTLIGLALLGLVIAFILRRYRQSRRRALRDSDFGTSFRRSAFVTPRSVTTPSMAESDHNVAPSLKEPYLSYPTTTAQPPSQALATATAAAAATATATTATTAGGLQERPKYVYGQDPRQDDTASDIAHGGAYSSQPQVQSTYNAEAYGSYAKYEDVGDGVVGGVPGGAAMYQDAERAYQGQQGYDQGHHETYASQYPSYDPSQFIAYGQPQQNYQAYGGAGAHTDAYGGM